MANNRRVNPKDDIATLLANATIHGKPLTDEDLTGYFIIIATAGHDTTSSSMSTVMYALATQPNLLQRVQKDISLVPALIEEAIRWGSPVKTFMRSAVEDLNFNSRPIQDGDWLMLCCAAANRDPLVFSNGATFDLDRGAARHLAFGKGVHVCLGQHLARLELRTFYENFIPKIKQVQITDEPQMSNSYFVNGLKKLPINIEYY